MDKMHRPTNKQTKDLKSLAAKLMGETEVDSYILKRNIMNITKKDVSLSNNQIRWWYNTAQINGVEAPDSLTKLVLELKDD